MRGIFKHFFANFNICMMKQDFNFGSSWPEVTRDENGMMSYANGKIEELDKKRQSPVKAIADMTAGAVSPNKLNQISDYLNDWPNVDMTDKRFVLDGLINKIDITSENVKIEWKI